MYLNWYGYIEEKHKPFNIALKEACIELQIDIPRITNFGVEDAVVGVYYLENYGQISWFGDGRDDLKQQLLENIEWNRQQEIIDKQKALEKESEINRLNKLTKEELEFEISALKINTTIQTHNPVMPKPANRFEESVELISNMINQSIQTPEKVGNALKTIANRFKLVELEEFYNKKFIKHIDNTK